MTTDSTTSNEQPPAPASKPKSPWRIKRFSFSLRIMMILVIAIAVPLSWKINSARRQARAIAQIRRMGGSIRYIDEHAGRKSHLSRWMGLIPDCIPGMYRVRGWLGPDFFEVVGEVRLNMSPWMRNGENRPHIEALASLIANFPKLKSLIVYDSDNVSILPLITAAPTLDSLTLSGGGRTITADDMKAIAKLKSLMSFDPDWSKFTEDAVPELARLRKLQTLHFNDTEQSQQLSDVLGSLPNLTKLELWFWPFRNDVDLRRFTHLRSLRSLKITSATVSDASINELIEALPNLIELDAQCSDAPPRSVQRRRDQIRESRERSKSGSTASAQCKN